MHIVYVSDGKAGHRSQALGLYQAMHKQHAQTTFEEISIEQLPFMGLVQGWFTHRVKAIRQPPDFIFGVGSHTHLRVWCLGKAYPKAKTVILMKPGLPIVCFDYAVIPAHDGVPASDRVIVTQGALNPIENEYRHKAGRVLIALGGDSKRHQWNEAKVLDAIAQITQQNAQSQIIVTTSRRTPVTFLSVLKQQAYAGQLQIFPVEETPQGWIFEQMQLAEAVWVTEDSVSMIFEALTAGCKVGLIKMDQTRSDRITLAIELLLKQNIVSQKMSLEQLPAQHTFKEAERVATYLLKSRLG